MKDIRKALETIALGYSQGNCSVDKLIRACNKYKNRIGFVDSFDYDVIVSKSCIDFLNGVKVSDEIQKAIIPGQTKVLDGVMYVYSKTKAGSKEDYAWHVVRKGVKTKADVGRGSKLDDSKIKAKQKYVNELFPNDLSSLKEIKTLNGSTQPKLVEDEDGNQYVLKKSSNTNAEHVKLEYLANQLYGMMGQKTPDYELYEDGGNVYLLSRFLQGTHLPTSADCKNLSKGFLSDCILNNWDVFQNEDNCLVKANGQVVRVDNGGCFHSRAQGKGNKPFDSDILKTFKDMSSHNPGVAEELDYDDALKQIQDIRSKKNDIVNFLIESGEDEIAKTIGERIDNLKDVEDYINDLAAAAAAKTAAKMGKVKPRDLKPEDEMYADISDDKVDEFISSVAKQNGLSKTDFNKILFVQDTREGWALLSKICQERGFDARPRVVDEKEFWKLRGETKQPLMYRGFDKKGFLDDFLFSDRCHFGSFGVWGQGIYAHCDDKSKFNSSYDKHSSQSVDNNSTKDNYKSSKPYSGHESAMTYSGQDSSKIIKMVWEPDAKIVNTEDLLDEIKDMGAQFQSDPQKVAEAKKKYDEAKKDLMDKEIQVQNLKDTIKNKVYDDINYNESSVIDMQDTFDNIDWGTRNIQGKRNYPMFDDIVKVKIKKWVEDCGGKVNIINEGEGDEQAHIEINGAELYISKYSWNNNAVKQKNAMTKPYHYQAEKFLAYFDTNCIKPAAEAVQREITRGDMAKKLNMELQDSKMKFYDARHEYDKVSSEDIPDTIYGQIYKRCKSLNYQSSGNDSKSLLGIYAALKGYDGMYQPDGNYSGHGFAVIFNRSKIITTVN